MRYELEIDDLLTNYDDGATDAWRARRRARDVLMPVLMLRRAIYDERLVLPLQCR